MKYRIWTNQKVFKLQRKRFIGWVWLDETRAWCNWYGTQHPYIFDSEKEVFAYLHNSIWEIKTEIINN